MHLAVRAPRQGVRFCAAQMHDASRTHSHLQAHTCPSPRRELSPFPLGTSPDLPLGEAACSTWTSHRPAAGVRRPGHNLREWDKQRPDAGKAQSPTTTTTTVRLGVIVAGTAGRLVTPGVANTRLPSERWSLDIKDVKVYINYTQKKRLVLAKIK